MLVVGALLSYWNTLWTCIWHSLVEIHLPTWICHGSGRSLLQREHKRVAKELEASRQVLREYTAYERVYLERQLGQNASQGNLVSVRRNEAVNHW